MYHECSKPPSAYLDELEFSESSDEELQDDISDRIESDLHSLDASSNLQVLKMSELRKRAEAAGVHSEKVEEAGDDEENPAENVLVG